MTLKEMMKLAGLKTTDLAQTLCLEYSHVSTALSMEERGETPKRSSVRLRIETIREHLEMLAKVADRVADGDGDGVSSDKPRRPTLWDSPQIAAKRFSAPRGCEVSHELDGFKYGCRVRLRLEPDKTIICRFFRVVTPEGRSPYVDLFDQETGAMRSVRLSELTCGERAAGG